MIRGVQKNPIQTRYPFLKSDNLPNFYKPDNLDRVPDPGRIFLETGYPVFLLFFIFFIITTFHK